LTELSPTVKLLFAAGCMQAHRRGRLVIIAQIPLGSTRHDSTRSTCRAHAFWLCRASRTAQLDSLDTTNATGSTGSTCRARRARLAT